MFLFFGIWLFMNSVCFTTVLRLISVLLIYKIFFLAKKACEMEATCVRKLLEDIEKLRKKRYELQRGNLVGRGELMQMLSHNARTAPLWIGPPDTHPPVLVGAIPALVSMSLKVSFYRSNLSPLFEKIILIQLFLKITLINLLIRILGWYGSGRIH